MTNLDTLIRDLTKVHPLSKSEAKAALQALLQQERVRAKVEMMELQNTAWASINDSTGLIAAAIRDNKRYIKRCLAELRASLGGKE